MDITKSTAVGKNNEVSSVPFSGFVFDQKETCVWLSVDTKQPGDSLS